MSKKLISIISPCFNEAENIDELYSRVMNIVESIEKYQFEYVFIDNASTDDTVNKLKTIASKDKRVKIIVNNRNFGHIRSPYWGILQTTGVATIYLASDLQDPPELIPLFLEAWERGSCVVLGVKPTSHSDPIMHYLRRTYYKLLDSISDIKLTRDTTGFGLYDMQVREELKKINDPYPYLRGLIDELGFDIAKIEFVQPKRIKGITKNNFYSLYDMAMLGLVSHSYVPLRLISFIGMATGFLSIVFSLMVLFAKILWWEKISAGVAPITIILFLMFAILMFSIGMLGEYISVILRQVNKRPIVVERERINFDD